jgi:trimeric autotransporter adhesin
LNGPAPVGGAVVALFRDNAAVTVPASVVVPAGANSATFTATTAAVPATTIATVTANLNGSTATAQLSVNPPSLSALTLNPASVIGGNPSIATIQISGAAPLGGVVVALTSSNVAVASLPANVTVPAGATSTTATITTAAVSANTTASVTATYGTTFSASLAITVQSVTFSSITLNPTSVRGGVSSTATASLGAAAPAGGVRIALSSNNAAAQVPPTLTIPAGATSGTFSVTTSPVAANASATISGSYGTITRNAILTITAAALSGSSVSPAALIGGASSTGTVTLNGQAATDAVVSLSSNKISAIVPPSVTVPAGQSSATFKITTNGVLANDGVTITASYAGVNRTASLTVKPAQISSLTLTPTSVRGGTSLTGTVVFSGIVPTDGTIALTSSNAAVASMLSPAAGNGTNTMTFSITTYRVTATRNATISVSFLKSSAKTTLTVNP